jgi:hypothetical protein
MKRSFVAGLSTPFALIALLCVFPSAARSQATDPKAVPVVDGGAGPCSAEFTVTDSAGTPVYDAKVRVHIAYRFMNAHKLDLEVGTNTDGKARVEGLPNKLKHGLTFYASRESQEGSAFDDPATTCKAQLTIALRPKTR